MAEVPGFNPRRNEQPKRKEGSANIDTLPLSRDTHGAIVREIVSLTNVPNRWDMSADEVEGFDGATTSGRLSPESIVGKGIPVRYPLDNTPYSVSAFFITFNESFGVSDLPEGEKEVARAGILIDHNIDAPPNRYASVSLGIKADARITYDLYSTGTSDSEHTKVIETELKQWGVDAKLLDGQDTKKEGNFTEPQGKQLLRTLRETNEEE